jgi:FkbM family methyltransferase
MPIPKTIHQTFEYKNLSSDLQSIVNEWSIENPLFFYKMYDKTEREEFIKENFLPEVYDAYKRIKPGAFKADLWRYCILCKFGGFYADVDTLCFGNLEEFIQKDVDFVAPIDLFDPNLGTYNVANGFIGCIPNHPIMMSCIKRIVKWVELEEFPKYNLDFSGPGCMGKAINEHLGREENKSLIGYQGIHQRIMLIHFEPQTEYIRSLSNKKILQNKNGNSYIKNAYDEECKKNPNYIDWGKYHRFQDIVETNLYSPSLSIFPLENYHNDETAYFYLYKYCGISDCIRRGYKWEEHQHAIINKYLTPDSIAVEVGSHIGTITVKLSKVVKEVYAFEPFKSSYDLLEKNLKLNNCHNVKIFNKGVSNTCSSTHIKWVSDNNPGGLGLEGGEITKKGNQNQKIKVELLTLDSLYLKGLDFLKIDVEGFETQVINGSQKTIKEYMPLIVIEIFEDMVTGIKASDKTIMERFGFLFEIGYVYEHIYFEDFLFIPPNLTKNK